MNKQYAVVIKTGDAEIRAIENLPKETISKILPIIELTRGRKIIERSDKERDANKRLGTELYPLDKRLEKVTSIFSGQTICLDLTADISLSNKKIDELYTPDNGYENWIKFLVDLKQEGHFEEIIPCIVINVEDDNFEENLKSQVRVLTNHFKNIVYRNTLSDDNCYDDMDIIKSEIKEGTNLIFMVDCGYIVPASHTVFLEKVKHRVKKLHETLSPNTKYIICGTSFPKQVSDIGNDYTDTFKLIEKQLFENLCANCDSNLIYADYGTINPIRNDEIIMARGWIPRIDVPTTNDIYYYRIRRPKGTTQYKNTYIEVAKLCKKDSRFPHSLKTNWGVLEIIRCADGKPSSSSPSFWISARMNIHIQQQTNLL